MKTLLIGLLIFSILLPSILAADANSYEAGDFDKNPEQIVVLAERDLVRINWEGKEHQIHVRKIYYPEKQKVDLTAFIEGSEVPFYATINPKTSLQLDFDKDDNFDLKVSIFNIPEEDKKKFVALKLEKLDTAPVTSEAIKENKSFWNHSLIYSLIGIILICLAVWKRRIVIKTYRKLKKR